MISKGKIEAAGISDAHQLEEVLLRVCADLRGGTRADKRGDGLDVLWTHRLQGIQKALVLLLGPIPACIPSVGESRHRYSEYKCRIVYASMFLVRFSLRRR
jgi:hypothetical protein